MKDKHPAIFELWLYVTGSTPHSTRASVNIRKICEEHLKGRYNLQVVDISQNPVLACQRDWSGGKPARSDCASCECLPASWAAR